MFHKSVSSIDKYESLKSRQICNIQIISLSEHRASDVSVQVADPQAAQDRDIS